MSDYHWVITKDFIADGAAVGTIGPSTATLSAEEIRDHHDAEKFRLYDDDGKLYYEGYAVFSPYESGFEPLDDYGTPNAGCTRIDFFETSRQEWVTL